VRVLDGFRRVLASDKSIFEGTIGEPVVEDVDDGFVFVDVVVVASAPAFSIDVTATVVEVVGDAFDAAPSLFVIVVGVVALPVPAPELVLPPPLLVIRFALDENVSEAEGFVEEEEALVLLLLLFVSGAVSVVALLRLCVFGVVGFFCRPVLASSSSDTRKAGFGCRGDE
jgi:hypothetical protein